MKLKTFLLAAVLMMIIVQTIAVTYYGIDRLTENMRQNEISNLSRIANDFERRITFFDELKASLDYFINNPELSIKILLENKNQLKFLCGWFMKTAGISSLATANFENKILFKSQNLTASNILTQYILNKNAPAQTLYFSDTEVFAVYCCAIGEKKKITGYISALKKIDSNFIDNFCAVNNIEFVFNTKSAIVQKNKLRYEIFLKGIDGTTKKITVLRSIGQLEKMLIKMKKNFIFISLSIAISVYFIGYLIVYRIGISLKRLENSAKKIAAGDFNSKPHKSRISEINRLIAAFEKMSAELKKSQEIIIRQEKLNLAGKLAGGIAHELNNPLAAALGYTQMLLEKNYITEPQDNNKFLHNIEKNIIRSRMIVKSLLNFSAKKNICKFESSLNQIIEDCIQLVKYNADKKGAKIIMRAEENLTIFTDKELLKQVIINIIFNAIDAIPQNIGIIEIISKKSVTKNIIEIIDNGSGIAENNMPNIFEPFYSTKKENEGTGLGLFLCYSYMKMLDGEIEIKNNLHSQGVVVRLSI